MLYFLKAILLEFILKNRLFFIGNTFSQNHTFRSYIIREIERVDSLHSVEYFNEADISFVQEIQRRTSQQEKIYIVTTKKSFTLVGKLLATLLDDRLVLTEEMLIPSKCEYYKKDSYLLDIGSASVNVLQIEESTSLPEILFITQSDHQKLHFFEIPIDTITEQLQALSKPYELHLTYSQIVQGWVEVQITCNTYGSVVKFLAIVVQRYHEQVIITHDLVEHIIDALLQSNKKITLAESCTGGLLAYYFTSHAGVSSVFEGSLVTYSNILKENWLAVESDTLIEHGAVSEAVVQEMCEGARTIANADYALAISGIAGPDGGTPEKPVGTVVIGFHSQERTEVCRYHFQGDRNYIQNQSALTALKMLVLGDKKVFFTN